MLISGIFMPVFAAYASMKCLTRYGISSLRSRSGGMRNSLTSCSTNFSEIIVPQTLLEFGKANQEGRGSQEGFPRSLRPCGPEHFLILRLA